MSNSLTKVDYIGGFVQPLCEFKDLYYYGNTALWVVRSKDITAPHFVYPADITENTVKKVYIRQTGTKYDDARPIRLASLLKRNSNNANG